MLNFANPAWLFGLLLLPLFALMHWQQIQREHSAIEAFAREPLWGKMGLTPGTEARLWRGILVIAAIACALVALAEPRWGASGAEGDIYQQGSLVVLLDVSKSMLANDEGGDSRLHAAQHVMDDLLPQLAGWKIGVVAFAGDGQALVPLTTDHSAVDTLLARAQPGQAPGKGSNLESGLKTSIGLFTYPGRKVLLVLSDGEELSGNGRSLIPQLRQQGVQVFSVGCGSTAGTTVPGGQDMWGNPTPITYRGQQVVSKLQEDTLKSLAADTGGQYFRPDSPLTVRQLGAQLGAGAATQATGREATGPGGAPAPGADKPKQGYELFQVPLALALLLVLTDAVWGLVGRPRREDRFVDHLRAHMGGPASSRGGGWLRKLGARLKRPAAYLLLLGVAWSQTAWTLTPSWVPNWQAGKAYQQGDYERAGTLLKGAMEADPDNWRLIYNRGVVGYANGNYYGAINDFQRAWDLADPPARPTIGYNLGNAHFRQGEATGDPNEFKRAIEEYQRVLQDKPNDADAKHNLALARQRLKEALKQPPKQGRNGQPQQGGSGGQGNQQMPVGVQTQHKPLPEMRNLPSDAEVDSLLKALESDERQRQAEQAAEQPQQDGQGGMGQNLLQQALGAMDLDKDW